MALPSLASLLVACCVIATAVAAPSLTVNVTGGLVQGELTTDGLAAQWIGIPFAAPPVGSLRWKPPSPPTPWSDVRVVNTFSPACAQPKNHIYPNTSEDCLYLNVYVPANPSTDGPLPVMLWFYGGTWISGNAGLPVYDGVPDVVKDKDVIIVSTNYRLGPFGFLGSSTLRNRSSDGSTGNYGILDQRYSMRWVQANIAAFGGDPTKVTIFGESAGAGSVSTHLVMAGSKGLFHQALMESGPMTSWVGMPLSTAELRYDAVLNMTGCATVDCLLTANTTELEIIAAKVPLQPGSFSTQWGPVVDGVELLGLPMDLAAKGEIASLVPTLLGTNHDEGSMFVPCSHTGSNACTESYAAVMLALLFNSTNAERIMKMYPASSFKSPFFQLSRIIGDFSFTCAARRTARWMLAAGAPSSHVYFFTHRPWWIDARKPWLGVAHTSELPFVFQFSPFLHTPGEVTLGANVAEYWTNFAATGSPNGNGASSLPQWPAYEAATDMTQNLNFTISTITALKEDVCDMWDTMPGS